MKWKNNSGISLMVYRANSIKPEDHHRVDIIRPAVPYNMVVSEMIVNGNSVSRATSVCVIALLLCLTSRATGEYESREISNDGSNDRSPGNNFGSCTDGKCIKRTTQEIASGMWFGPRLGRRRRSDEKPEMESDVDTLMNSLDGIHWAVIKIPINDKKQSTQFIPFLERGSSENLFYNDATEKSEEDDHPLFVSRLGHRLSWIPSSRLGRQLRSIVRKM